MPITYEQETPQEKWYWRWINKAPTSIVGVFMVLAWATGTLNTGPLADLIGAWKNYAGIVLTANAIHVPVTPAYTYDDTDKSVTITFPTPVLLEKLVGLGFVSESAWLNVSGTHYDSDTSSTQEGWQATVNFDVPVIVEDGQMTITFPKEAFPPGKVGPSQDWQYYFRVYVNMVDGDSKLQYQLTAGHYKHAPPTP